MTDVSLSNVRAFLADHTTLSLATIGPDGEPQAANLYYAETHDLTLYFVSAASSRHVANVARDPRVAVTVYADSTGWRDIRGVQLEGTCTHIAGTKRAKGWARYTAKFPFILTDPALARALQKVEMYRITPHWLRWIDNSVSLGHNQEWRMAARPDCAARAGPGMAGS